MKDEIKLTKESQEQVRDRLDLYSFFLDRTNDVPDEWREKMATVCVADKSTTVPVEMYILPFILKNPIKWGEVLKAGLSNTGDTRRLVPVLNGEFTRRYPYESASFGIHKKPINTAISYARSYYKIKGEDVPKPLKEAMYQDFPKRFIHSHLVRSNDEIIKEAAKILIRDFPWVIHHDALLPNMKFCTIFNDDDGKNVLCVTDHETILTFFVPDEIATTNEGAVLACSEELRSLLSGKDATLSRAKRLPIKNCGDDASIEMATVEEEIGACLSSFGSAARDHFARFHLGIGKISAIKERLEDAIIEAKQELFAALSQDVVSLSKAFGFTDLDVLSWMSGSDDFQHHADFKQRRQDVEDFFSGFGQLFYQAKHEAVRKAVSERGPVMPVIRQITGLSKTQVQAVSALKTPDNPSEIIKNPAPFSADAISVMSVDEMRLGSWVVSVCACGAPDAPLDKVSASVFKAVSSMNGDAHDSLDIARDAVKDLEKWLIGPICEEIQGRRDELTEALIRAHLYPRSVRDILRMSDAYHEHNVSALLNAKDHNGRQRVSSAVWDPLTKPLKQGTLTARELSGTPQIIQQGQLQRHCVGSYTDQVLAGWTLILSVDEGNKPISTVELTVHVNGDRVSFSVPQHRAACNAEPTERAKAALRRFLIRNAEINRASLRAYHARLVRAKEKGIKIADDLSGVWRVMTPMLAHAGVADVNDVIFSVTRDYENGRAFPLRPVPRNDLPLLSRTEEGYDYENWGP